MPEPTLPYGRQHISEEDVRHVVEALRSDFLTTGPVVPRFERELARHTGTTCAVAVNSGTAALHTAYYAAGLQAGEEIVTSPLTFLATANAARYLGAGVRFVDVEPDTGNLDPQAVRAAIGERTRLIVPVDYAGHPADYDPISDIAERAGLTVVTDAAHSLGGAYHGRPVGTLAALSAVSFHPVKAVTTGEGGAVVTRDDELAHRARLFRNHGMERAPDRLSQDEGPWYYEMQALGFNYRITDLQCALGLSQLTRLDAFLARRREIAAAYNEAFSAVEGLRLPAQRPDVAHAWHLYVVRVEEPQRRRAFFERLREQGLGVQVHYIPVYWQPYYQALGYRRGLCPQAEDFYARAVSLPIFPGMSDANVARVIDTVQSVAREVL